MGSPEDLTPFSDLAPRYEGNKTVEQRYEENYKVDPRYDEVHNMNPSYEGIYNVYPEFYDRLGAECKRIHRWRRTSFSGPIVPPAQAGGGPK